LQRSHLRRWRLALHAAINRCRVYCLIVKTAYQLAVDVYNVLLGRQLTAGKGRHGYRAGEMSITGLNGPTNHVIQYGYAETLFHASLVLQAAPLKAHNANQREEDLMESTCCRCDLVLFFVFLIIRPARPSQWLPSRQH
jgi:hypothetical protein